MKQHKATIVWPLVGLTLFAVGMAAALRWDLSLTQVLYRPSCTLALWMECFGWYPLYLPTVLWAVLTATAPGRPAWLRALCTTAALAGAGVMVWQSYSNLLKRGTALLSATAQTAAVWALLAVGLAALLALVHRRGTALGARLCFAFRWATVYLVAQTALVQLLKLLWARTRFDTMLEAGSFARFTAWVHPFGNGGSSFPSGHTAAACGIFVLVLLCSVLPRWGKHRTLVWGLCWAYVAAMALSRLMMGRHFLSDTLMAAFSMTLLFFALVHSRLYRAAYARLQRTAPYIASTCSAK